MKTSNGFSNIQVLNKMEDIRKEYDILCASTGKGIRGSVKGLGLREKELQELEAEDLENMTEASLDSFNQEAANIEG